MSPSKKVVVVGGHGKVALRLTALLTAAAHSVTSIIRTAAHAGAVQAAGATPRVLSLEDSPTADFTDAFRGADVVYFSAGAGGRGGEARTKAVDFDGAVKVFDALEAGEEPRPRLVLVSCMDVRDPEKVPAHYTQEDLAVSRQIQASISVYLKWKYEADKDLARRTAFRWTMLRPGGLTDEPGTGTASIGRTHLTTRISRDDVAMALFLLLDREGAAGLGIDFVGGETPIAEGLDAVIRKGESDFLG
ncbi:unnamed protein product [Mycena citricolor]|uniref:NAD(P)-binding domain-containing protein n=1 Tax=Mycena citricolor TaxID=2018698 RepID=A0AAD2H8D7_9AGAR|nr:unnamed protein product [Mycena citricolor]